MAAAVFARAVGILAGAGATGDQHLPELAMDSALLQVAMGDGAPNATERAGELQGLSFNFPVEYSPWSDYAFMQYSSGQYYQPIFYGPGSWPGDVVGERYAWAPTSMFSRMCIFRESSTPVTGHVIVGRADYGAYTNPHCLHAPGQQTISDRNAGVAWTRPKPSVAASGSWANFGTPDTGGSGGSVVRVQLIYRKPTPSPTASPSTSPSTSPTSSPTASPSVSPSTSPTSSPTASPTSSPSSSPTPSPSPPPAGAAAGFAGGSVSGPVGGSGPSAAAVGDPHFRNVLGQRFDLLRPGVHALLSVPRGSRREEALVLVEADAKAMGGTCSDVYFQTLNVTGAWAGEHGSRYSVDSPHDGNTTGWVAFGRVDLKVTWGRTVDHIRYLNVFAKRLTEAGFAVGGLLGEDNHEFESTPPGYCQRTVALADRARARALVGSAVGSTAEAM